MTLLLVKLFSASSMRSCETRLAPLSNRYKVVPRESSAKQVTM